jgi:opacity protein-like surface antigen
MNSLRHLLVCGLVLTGSLAPLRAQIPSATDYFARQNKFDVYGVGQYLHQDDARFNGPYGTTRLKLDDTGLGGIGMAYHFNDFLAVHADFLFGPATFTVVPPTGPSYSLGDNGLISSGRFNLDYNIINRRITPFITAGVGYQYMQVDQTYYYPHGYYYYDYYSETDFTWNVGGGIRWNVTDNFFVKLTGGAQWLTYLDADNISMQIEGSFAIGMTFP